MGSATALIIQKERTVNTVRKVIMTHPGDRPQLRIPLNAEVGFFMKRLVSPSGDQHLNSHYNITT